jgi:DNA-binding NarL/FixJ family response regulator
MEVSLPKRHSCGMTATALAPAAFAADHAPRRRLTLVDRAEHLQGSDRREIRVLIAHGQALVRAGVRSLLESGQSIAVVGEAGKGEDAVALARRLSPDVVLIEATLPGLDVIEATRQIALLPGVRVMMLTATDTDDLVFASLRAGASALVVQNTEPRELVRAIRLVADGQAPLSPSLTRRLIAKFVSQTPARPPDPGRLEELTDREREVMALAARGLTNDEIAQRLVLSPATAKTHVSRAMVKLHARDRAQLVAIAYQSGLVSSRHSTTPDTKAPGPRGASWPLPRAGLPRKVATA